ncbi:MAG: class I SAM-dependent methyltransferase [Rhodospirillales bacterium]
MRGHFKIFLTHRTRNADNAGLAGAVADCCHDENADLCRTVAASVAESALPVTSKGGLYKILEVGCSNGNLVNVLRTMLQDGGIRVTGVEQCAPWAEDFQTRFSEHRMITSDIDAFPEMGADAFPEAPFDAFYSGMTFLMMPPDAVRAVLAKAAALCRKIIIFDFVFDGALDINADGAMIFLIHGLLDTERSVPYFAHDFPKYLDEVGFDVESVTPTPVLCGEHLKGWGVLHAVPRSG